MTKSITRATATYTKERAVSPQPSTMPNGAGVVQGSVYRKPFMPSTSIKSLNTQALATGATTNGMRNTGLRTIGAPKRKGSLTPKVTGMAEARPTARSSLDLARKANIMQGTSVAPVPPMVTTKYCRSRLRA